jgi:WD40-like Beta Propeller Repeat
MAKTDPRGIVAARAGTLLAVGLVVLIMVVLEAHPARATFPGKPGKIVYDAYDGPKGDLEIYTINPDGGGRVQLTDNSTDDYDPSYSPSGKKIAYDGLDAPTNGDFEIYTIKAAGRGGRFQVTDNATDDFEPFWRSK